MFIFSSIFWSEVFESICRKPSRTILTGIGVAWGILILIVLLGVGAGLEKGIYRLFEGFSKNTAIIYSTSTSMKYKGKSSGRRIFFTQDDLEMLTNNIEGVEYASPYVGKIETISTGQKHQNYEVRGVYPCYFDMKLIEMEKGRRIHELDMNRHEKVVIIGKNVAEVLFEHKQPIGEQMVINDGIYKVVGVIKSNMLNKLEERVIYMPYSTYALSISSINKFSTIFISTNTNYDWGETKERIKSFMARKYNYNPNDKNVLYFESFEEQADAFSNLFKGLKSFLWFLGLSTLISGIIGVSNIIYSTTKERTREIGIHISIGARPSRIKSMIICESITITSISGYIGILLGCICLLVISSLITENNILLDKPNIDFSVIVAASLILVVSGTLAGLKPAIYAANLNPIEALKEEN